MANQGQYALWDAQKARRLEMITSTVHQNSIFMEKESDKS